MKQSYELLEVKIDKLKKERDKILNEEYIGKSTFENLCKSFINETYFTIILETSVDSFIKGSFLDSVFNSSDGKKVIEYSIEHKTTEDKIVILLEINKFKGLPFSQATIDKSPLISKAIDGMIGELIPKGLISIDIEESVTSILSSLLKQLYKSCMDALKRDKEITMDRLADNFVMNTGVLFVDEVKANSFLEKSLSISEI